nr:peptidylprolyl isomerase [Shimia biformata]
MSKQLKFLRSTVLAIALATPVFAAEEPTAETVVATVNGQDITLGQMIILRAALPEQYNQFPADVLFTGILDQLIQQSLVAEARQNNVPLRVEMSLKNERLQLLAAEALADLLADAVTEEKLQAAYDARFVDGKGPVEFNASHILVDSQEKATEVLETLKAGADFAETAKTESTGPSGPSGGELGWFGTGQMVQPFEDAVAALEVGALSEPVATQFGWHIIKLNDKRFSDAPPLDQVRQELTQELQEKIVDDHVTALTENAAIDKAGADAVDPSMINNIDLLQE